METARQPLLRPSSLASRVADAMRADIAAGRLAPGARLPAEAALATSFAVSRPVVREAIAQLKADGVLVTRKGSGTYVSANPAGQVWRLPTDNDTAPTLGQLFELRLTVETACAALAARRRTESDLEAIRRALEAMHRNAGDYGLAAQADIAFHQAIVRAAHNPCFSGLTDFVGGQLLAARQAAWENAARVHDGPHGPHGAHAEHQALAAAIAEGDPEAAAGAARRHLEAAARRMGLTMG